MSTPQPPGAGDEAHRPAARDDDAAVRRPTVDEMSEWSFPASDPPATWTWEPRARRRTEVAAASADRPPSPEGAP
jgi:hypothetical protein